MSKEYSSGRHSAHEPEESQHRIISWETPPPSNRGRREGNPRPSMLDHLAAELRARPRRWAVVFEGNQVRAGSTRNSINGGLTTAFSPAGSFEACVRTDRGKTRVFARFVGEPDRTWQR